MTSINNPDLVYLAVFIMQFIGFVALVVVGMVAGVAIHLAVAAKQDGINKEEGI